MVVAGLSSTLSLTKRTSSRCSDISSRIGEIRRHGTHHGAQKSTITGFSDFRTSLSNVASVTSTTAMNTNLRSEEHTSELQSRQYLVCRLLLEKKKINIPSHHAPAS